MSRVSDDVMDDFEAEMLRHLDRLPTLGEVEEFEDGVELVEPDMVRRYKDAGLGPTASGVHVSRLTQTQVSASAGETASRVTRTPGGSSARTS